MFSTDIFCLYMFCPGNLGLSALVVHTKSYSIQHVEECTGLSDEQSLFSQKDNCRKLSLKKSLQYFLGMWVRTKVQKKIIYLPWQLILSLCCISCKYRVSVDLLKKKNLWHCLYENNQRLLYCLHFRLSKSKILS